jgi:hypothetical protein
VSDVDIPNFGELLAPYLGQVTAEAYPYLLSQLERTAADRYRGWAEALPEHAAGLLECAAREDEIADRVEALFPPADEHRRQVADIMPGAKAAYYQVFEGLSPLEQMTIQENAERQGAGAWQNLKASHPDHGAALDALSAIELQSADHLEALLAELA